MRVGRAHVRLLFTRNTSNAMRRLLFYLAKSLSFRFRRMVLVVGGVVLQEEIPADSRSLYAAHPVYRESAAQLHSMPAKLVGPVGLLYVQQREMAATLPHDSKCDASRCVSSSWVQENERLNNLFQCACFFFFNLIVSLASTFRQTFITLSLTKTYM